jgi:voltage-gated sodium channel
MAEREDSMHLARLMQITEDHLNVDSTSVVLLDRMVTLEANVHILQTSLDTHFKRLHSRLDAICDAGVAPPIPTKVYHDNVELEGDTGPDHIRGETDCSDVDPLVDVVKDSIQPASVGFVEEAMAAPVSQSATGSTQALRQGAPSTTARNFLDHVKGSAADVSMHDGGGSFTRFRKRVRRTLKEHMWWLDWLVGFVVLANTVCIGLEIQIGLDGGDTSVLESLEHVFLTFFVVELGIRMLTNFSDYMRSGWFYLDVTCSVAGVVTTWIFMPVVYSSQDRSVVSAVSQLTIMKVLRLLRLIRALRLLEIFHELWALCQGMVCSCRTVLAACVLLFLAIYIFSCMGIEAMRSSDSLNANPTTRAIVKENFDSLPKAALTLVSFTNADSLSQLYTPIIQQDPWTAPFFFCIWLVITVSLMNLVTAVIVDQAIQQHKENEKLKIAAMRKKIKVLTPQIETVFVDLDTSGDQFLAYNEIDFTDVHLPAGLREFIDEDKLKDLFQFLDMDGSGTVDKAEFVDGIMHLMLQDIPIETTQTLQLLRAQQAAIESLHKQISKGR